MTSVMTLIDFPIVVKCPYLSGNMQESYAYGVFVSQMIRYARVRNAQILTFVQGIYFGFKVIKAGIFFT